MAFRDHYINWNASRLAGIKKYIGPEYFKNKTMIEIGYAHVGDEFSRFGAHVTSCDARKENLVEANKLFPHIKTFVFDADNDLLPQKYDICLHWGVLYHLNNIDSHIKDISSKCDVLLLETEVCDSDDPNLVIKIKEHDGIDQAYNRTGSRPSPKYVENMLEKNGFEFRMITDPIINSDDFHIYNWTIRNTQSHPNGLRRFWICWKNITSPLRTP